MLLEYSITIFLLSGRTQRSDSFSLLFKSHLLQEEIRLAVDTWSQTLLPAHFAAISACWNETLSKAPTVERIMLIAFLIQLLPHFPKWSGKK